ncbi:hypothetical protein GCM10019059_45350 [Camelimonas fluminis]|uniref:DUF2312 domain-containing protein n=1 Tax=Camelimonas fluminis TaxID=1576911 RepID=A0ABV7UBB6_9HYPH|nr:GapR family DNA-binding domain-containing protein [Camelimonas fluminis]GHE83816.1 hypothetical protein GCM10019059_45350 [Camelimonas fluminis]
MTEHAISDVADTGVAVEELKQFVSRADNIDDEIEEKQSDRKELYAELKARGFDVLAFKQMMKIRRMDRNVRQEREAILQLYLDAVGVI